MEFYQVISNNIVSLVTFALGVIVSYFFLVIGKKEKKPLFLIRTINLLRSDIKKFDTINIYHSNNKVENLSISKIAFWNGGKATISGDDIAKVNPIKINIDEQYEILEAKLIYQKNLANDFKVNLLDNKKSIDITFDYFDLNEGIVFQMLHTGNSSNDLNILGNVKSVKGIVNNDKSLSVIDNILSILDNMLFNKYLEKFIRKHISFIMFFIGLSMLIPLFYLLTLDSFDTSLKPMLIIIGFMSLVFVFTGLSMRRKVPKGFDVFNDEF